MTILTIVKITIGQLKALIAESLDNLPPRNDVEAQLQNAKFEKDIAAKVLSQLDRTAPTSAKLHLQSLASAVSAWQAGRGSWNKISDVLDKLYGGAGSGPRRHSYTSMKAVR